MKDQYVILTGSKNNAGDYLKKIEQSNYFLNFVQIEKLLILMDGKIYQTLI